MKISVYAICKNEESLIEDMIKSCINEVDEIVICDTGSTDNTIDIIKAYDVKLVNIHVSPWRFDDARNTALSQTTGDVCISLDADERIESGLITDLRKMDIQNSTLVSHPFKTIWDWQGESKNVSRHLHTRIHSRNGLRWNNCVHEELVGATNLYSLNTEYSIIQTPDLSKPRSYLNMLEVAVKETPNKWKLWFFLAQEYFANHEVDKAINAFNISKLCSNADAVYIDVAMYMLGILQNPLNVLLKNALEHGSRENWYYYALECKNQGKIEDEKFAINKAFEYTTPIFDYRYNPNAWN